MSNTRRTPHDVVMKLTHHFSTSPEAPKSFKSLPDLRAYCESLFPGEMVSDDVVKKLRKVVGLKVHTVTPAMSNNSRIERLEHEVAKIWAHLKTTEGGAK